MNLTSPKFKMSAFDNTVMKMKRQAIDWEKILANHRHNKCILCRLCKEFQNSREKFKKGKKAKKEF